VEFFLITPPLVHILWVYYVLPIAFGIRLSDLTSVILALTGLVVFVTILVRL